MRNLNPEIRLATPRDSDWVCSIIDDIGGRFVVSGGCLHDLRDHQTLLAPDDGQPIGMLTLRSSHEICEILALKVVQKRRGVGTALVQEAFRLAQSQGASTMLVITTNDNVDAMRFYQRIGFVVTT